MVREINLKPAIEDENILFSVGECEIKVTITLATFNHLISKSPADGSSLQTVIKVISN